MPEAVEYNILRTFKELSDLAPEWCALWLQDEHTTPFQHPDWLLPWTEQFAPRELRVITIRENGSLQALLPFYIHRDFESGESQLLLLGVGTSDYLDGIFAAGWKPDHIAGALRMLTR